MNSWIDCGKDSGLVLEEMEWFCIVLNGGRVLSFVKSLCCYLGNQAVG